MTKSDVLYELKDYYTLLQPEIIRWFLENADKLYEFRIEQKGNISSYLEFLFNSNCVISIDQCITHKIIFASSQGDIELKPGYYNILSLQHYDFNEYELAFNSVLNDD